MIVGGTMLKSLWTHKLYPIHRYTREELGTYSTDVLIEMYLELENKNYELNLAIDDLAYDYAKQHQLLVLHEAKCTRMEEDLNGK